MFQKDYDKNETHAFQTLTIAIQAGKKNSLSTPSDY